MGQGETRVYVQGRKARGPVMSPRNVPCPSLLTCFYFVAVRVFVPVASAVLVTAADFDGVRVADPVLLTVACGVDVLAAVCVGVTGTQVPHVRAPNPGAPGLDDTATYPRAHTPVYCTPHVAYPAGHDAHAGVPPVAYCPALHCGVEVGETLCVGVRVFDAATAASSRACGRDGDFVAVTVAFPVLVAAAERLGVRDAAGVLLGVRDAAGVLLGVRDAAGVLVLDTGMHDPHVDAMYPAEQVPVKNGSQQEKDAGQTVLPSARADSFTNPTGPSHIWYPDTGLPKVSRR